MQLAFGAGALWGNRTDVTGTGIGPDQFGILQDVQIDFDWTTKELWGQFQFPVDIARGQGKITGKAKFARIFGAIYGDLFFGQSPAAGQLTVSENEAANVPATTPFTIAVANASGYADDLGVYYANGGNAGGRFTRVTTPSAAGQYSVNLATGVYTFAAADANAAVAISYLYNVSSAGKKLVTLYARLFLSRSSTKSRPRCERPWPGRFPAMRRSGCSLHALSPMCLPTCRAA